MGVHNAIFKALEERDTWQGRLFSSAAERFPNLHLSADCEGVAT